MKKVQSKDEAYERERWKRFKRETKSDQTVLIAVLNARVKHDNDSRAAKAYDQLLLQLMRTYVSPAALARYNKGFTQAELEELNLRDAMAWGVVNAESQMLTSLQAMSRSHPLERQRDLNLFIEYLYLRWQYIDRSDGAGIEELSADGINVTKAKI